MKQSNTQKSIALEHQSASRVEDGSFDAIQFLPYDRILRTLGSLLQRENLGEFDLQHSDDVYTVRGQSSRMNPGRLSLFERIFRFAKSMSNLDRAITGELRYSVSDILRFETEVRAQRKESSEIPDPYFPSQILRGVGCYLDNREGSRLVGVKVKNRWVTIDYIARDGRVEKAFQDFEYFYDYGIKMYMQRSNRSKLPPPSDPTLVVTWEGAQKRHKLSRTTVV